MLLYGRGDLFAIADDAKILAQPDVMRGLAKSFPTIAWEEAGLATQTIKTLISVQQAARAKWRHYTYSTPRNSLGELPMHGIPDGSERVDPFDLDNRIKDIAG